jgi:protein-S-isoprenylcysteine O-methyltransferase Ste14
MKNKRLLIMVSVVVGLLCIPLIAMQFSEEVFLTSSDFVIMGILLLITGLLGELVLRKIKSKRNRIIVAAVILLTFLFVWAELAVGIVGSPFAGS